MAAKLANRPRILVVDDDAKIGTIFSASLTRAGARAETALGGREALERLRGGDSFDLMLLDLNMPKVDGLEVLRLLGEIADPPQVVVVTGGADVGNAVTAMQRGAVDLIQKPVRMHELLERVGEVLGESDPSGPRQPPAFRRPAVVAESPAMKRVLAAATKLAKSPSCPALILGESGAGKEVVAHWIHAQSRRESGPFVKVNVAAVSPTLFEAELFGTVAGSFTGADRDREGLFRTAGGGTLLLDEFCELELPLQAKLLRVLEDGQFYPVGSDRPCRADVRTLAATNRDPARAIDEGRLRRDMFYRLSTVILRVPPLRDRREDIALLARRFASDVAAECGVGSVGLSEAAQARLTDYRWPGNVRELRNVIERAVIMYSPQTIEAEHLDFSGEADTGDAVAPWATLAQARQRAIERAERRQIAKALARASGRIGEAATLLGVSRTTLWARLRRYGIQPPHADDS